MTKKTNKINSKTKTTVTKKGNESLYGFFSLMGVVLGISSIMALIVPMAIHAKQGTYIVEPFTCEVALADYAELQRRLEVTPRTDWKYEIFLDEYESVVKDLAEHAECEVK